MTILHSAARFARLPQCAALVLMAVWLFGVGPVVGTALCAGGDSSALELAARAPLDSMCVIAIDNPQELAIRMYAGFQDELKGNETLRGAWTDIARAARENAGFDLFDLSTYGAQGFNIAAPITLAFLKPGRRLEPSGGVVSVAVTSEIAAHETIAGMVTRARLELQKRGSDPGTYVIAHRKQVQFAYRIVGDRLYLAMGENRFDKVAQLDEFLRKSRQNPLAETALFKNTVAGLDASGSVSAFFNLGVILDGLDASDHVPLFDDLPAVALASDFPQSVVYALFAENSGFLRHAEKGVSCSSFLERFSRPTVAATASLKHPVRLLRYIMERGEDGDDLARIEQRFAKQHGFTLDEADSLIDDSAGGALAYWNDEPLEPFTYVAFARVTDTARALEIIGRLRATGSPELRHGDDVLFVERPPARFATGVIGDYVVAGTAVPELESAIRGEAKDWKPRIGGDDILALEMNPAQLWQSIADELPDGFPAPDPDDFVVVRAERRERGLRMILENSGQDPRSWLVSVIVERIVKDRRRAQSMACRSNLRMLGTLAELWSQDHKGRFPAARGEAPRSYKPLQWLADDNVGYLRTEMFVCPADDKSPAKIDEDGRCVLDSSTVSYHWITRRVRGSRDSKVVIAACPHHGDVVHVLQGDLRVVEVPSSTFRDSGGFPDGLVGPGDE